MPAIGGVARVPHALRDAPARNAFLLRVRVPSGRPRPRDLKVASPRTAPRAFSSSAFLPPLRRVPRWLACASHPETLRGQRYSVPVPAGAKTGSLCARMCARRCRPQPRHGPGVIADEQTVLATTGPANQPTGGSSFLPSRRPLGPSAPFSCLSTPRPGRWPCATRTGDPHDRQHCNPPHYAPPMHRTARRSAIPWPCCASRGWGRRLVQYLHKTGSIASD